MNKIFMGAFALLLAGAVASCDKCKDGACTTAAEADQELSTGYGNYVGAMLGSDFSRFDGENTPDKNKFLQGMQVVLGANSDRETRYGMQVALQLLGEMEQLDQNGVKMDRAAVMAAFRKTFKEDSLSRADVEAFAQKFQNLYMAAQENAKAAKAAEATAAEADNVVIGEEYVAQLKANDSEIVTLPSGLSYKIIEAGTGEKPAENANVTVNYSGRHINGEVFDANDGVNFNLQGVVPGFREGIMQLGKGGKATLYIPGELAYGKAGAPAAGIGPNEMLVFDVELVGIE